MDVGDLPVRQLTGWLGAWPPAVPVRVVVDPEPDRPAWDGGPRRVTGVADPAGRCLVRVPPEVAARLPDRLDDLEALLAALPAAVGRPGTAGAGALRWAQQLPDLAAVADAGVWLPAALADEGDLRVPTWLRPFGGDVLVALDEQDRHLAGVGLKRHTADLCEIAVVTDESARGRGLARRLVAQAARTVTSAGCAVLYLHAPGNEASARTARGSGFPDTGWRVVGFFEPGA